MSKLVINHLEKVFITSDAATIVGELEVEHPAAKMLTMAAKQQETEVGDGTNFVVTFTGELLGNARDLLRMVSRCINTRACLGLGLSLACGRRSVPFRAHCIVLVLVPLSVFRVFTRATLCLASSAPRLRSWSSSMVRWLYPPRGGGVTAHARV